MFVGGSGGIESRSRDFHFVIATNRGVFPIQRKLEDVPLRDDRAASGKSSVTEAATESAEKNITQRTLTG